ncbi:MAG: S-layer homology domain-containing protein, partial [Lutispora sp.]|nr:S-layer homology domain-containing protein [Lutispora sp.]
MKHKKIAAILTATILLSTTTMAFADTPFIDIEKNWAKAHIISVNEKGLMNGTEADKFSPDKAVDKYSAIISIARMMGTNNMDLNDVVNYQKDVLDKYKVPEYAMRETAFCLDKGIIQGEIEMDKFGNQAQATKLDVCVYLGRAFGVNYDAAKPPVILSYTDAYSIPSMYRVYIDHMIKIGVVDGKGDAEGLFNPNTPITRAMFAKMLDAASIEYVKTDITTDTPTEPVQNENADTITTPTDNGTAAVTKDKGTIDSITYSRSSQPKILLETENKTMTEYTIPEDLMKENIIINGQLSDVYSLRPGLFVEVEILSGKIDRISTIEIIKQIDTKGIIKQVDLINRVMTADIF